VPHGYPPAVDRRPLDWLRSEALPLILPSLVLALFLAPLVLAILGSLRPPGTAPPTSIDLWPAGAGASNYGDVLERPVLQRQLVNSLLVAAIAVPAGTLVASCAGYAIARLPRRAALLLLGVTVVTVAIPASSVFVGRLVLFRLLGVTDTPMPLVAPALIGVTPLLVLLFAWSYHTVPREIYDLATEAGLGPFRTWWHVAVPFRKGAVAVAVAVGSVVSWGNLSDPLLYVYDERWFTLPLGLASLAHLPPTDQGLMLAAAAVSIAPAVVTAFIVQRHLLERRV
jgi:multiple sugar transport system permease protein